MKDGFIKVGVATNDIVVANPLLNAKSIIKNIKKANEKKVNVLVFPELAISGYTCGDLFFQETLLNDSLVALDMIRRNTTRKNMLVVVGMPLRHNGKLYNVAAFLNKGKILGFVPKTYIPNHNEYSEARYFAKPSKDIEEVVINNHKYLLGTNLLFKCLEINEFVVGAEICEDLYVPLPPSIHHALNGATIICNPAASIAYVGKSKERLALVKAHSSKIKAGYLYSSSGEGESTQDVVFSSHNIICENGEVLNEKYNLKNNLVISEIDVKRIVFERSKTNTFICDEERKYQYVYFNLKVEDLDLIRSFPT